jgi:hypothetical protein
MSKASVAPRSRSTKPAAVVPIVRTPDSKSPADRARWDFEFYSETTSSMYLKGVRMVLDAWSVFERENSLGPDGRDHAMMFLGEAIEQMGERLEAKRMAWHAAEKAEATKKSA